MIRYADSNDLKWLNENDNHISSEVLRAKIHNKEVYISKSGGKCVGWLRYNLFWDNVPFMNMIGVLPEYQRQGIGARLMAHWETDMRGKGYTNVLTSTQSNEDAQHFYRKLGYVEIGGFKYLDDPYEIIFQKIFC